jgi:hypothetical protein
MPSSDIGVAVAKAELNSSVYNQSNFVLSWVVAIYFACRICRNPVKLYQLYSTDSVH